MAHELTIRTNGTAEMAYAGDKPWHNLGTKLAIDASSEDMLVAAQLDWEVRKSGIISVDGFEIPGKSALLRNDNNFALGVVSDDYQIIQNRDTFAFADALSASGSLKFETAGSLFGGKRIFATAKTANQIRIAGTDDVTENYLVLMNSFDGSLALKVFFTNIRVVCNNTLSAALKATPNALSVRHFGNVTKNMEEAAKILLNNERYLLNFEFKANALATRLADKKMVDTFLNGVFATTKDSAVAQDKVQEKKNIVTKLFEEDSKNNLSGIQGSMWSLWNAYVQFIDHGMSDRKTADHKFTSVVLGDASRAKSEAFQLAMAVSGI